MVVVNLLETVIDLDAIATNTRILKNLVQPAQLMCVVKADGYNHGAIPVARTVLANGADQLGVATLAEALELREAGITAPILCWIWSPEQDFAAALDANIHLAVVSMAHAQAIVKYAAGKPEKLVQTTIKIDTGLHRSGVDESQWEAVFTLLKDAGTATGNIEVTGVMSHLACADEPGNPANDTQAAAFNRAIALGRQLGLELPVNHLSNSPAVLTRPDFYHEMVRPGLAVYGYSPLADGNDYGLQPAMSWVGKVTVVKPIEPGEGTSYNLTWRAAKPGYLAVIPAGYADGLPRRAQNHVEVTIGGHRYPQVGRICMDQFVIDLGDNPHNVRPGDEAIIFGPGGMSAAELASRIQDINYAVICAPTGRTVRRYIGGQHA